MEGQAKVAAARVVIFGMGALGSTVADQLARAGVKLLRIVDRDVVEWTNLQRQTLYEEGDAARGLPKVEAAARRLRSIRGDLVIEPHAIDIDAGNIESLVRGVDLIVDGSDNAELRYLINDVSVKDGVPWVMGGAIGVEGRVAAFDPARGGPCLRCVFQTPPGAGELATCDTAGALGPVIGVVASMQVVEAMKLIVGDASGGAHAAHDRRVVGPAACDRSRRGAAQRLSLLRPTTIRIPRPTRDRRRETLRPKRRAGPAGIADKDRSRRPCETSCADRCRRCD